MTGIRFLTDQHGERLAVVLPVELWRRLFPREDAAPEELEAAIEGYCLGRVMGESTESALLEKIHEGIPEDLQSRFDELVEKRRDDALSEGEYEELLRLTEQVEELDAKRVEHLVELARFRRTTLSDLMAELGIKPPPFT